VKENAVERAARRLSEVARGLPESIDQAPLEYRRRLTDLAERINAASRRDLTDTAANAALLNGLADEVETLRRDVEAEGYR
jgi:AAA+ superfamily predicted ATPase